MIYLINPYITSAERYGKDIGDIGGHQLPLGIFSLAACLIDDGEEVAVIDAEAQRLSHEDVIEQMRQHAVRVIGITSTTVAFRNARSLAEMCRAALPQVPIVIGGPHMTAMPEATMATGAFDYGIIREGERPFSQLIRYLCHQQGTLEEIPNLYYVHEGAVHLPTDIEYVENLDTLPFPARHLCPDISRYKPPVGAFRDTPVLSIITSRGCPYRCIFCDNNTFGRKTRFQSAEYVVREIQELIENYGAREISFLDDTFVLDKTRLHRIFELLEKEKIRFHWTCMTRVNNLDYETLKFMRDHGCWQIRIGIESGNAAVLEFIKKGITLDQVRNVTRWCSELKIATTGFFMLGHHIDTTDTIEETIQFALSIQLTDIVATINTPIPGTESYMLAHEYGTFDEQDWTSLNYWTPVFVPYGLSREYLLAKQAELYKKFYFRLPVIAKQCGKLHSFKLLMMAIRSAIKGLRFVK
ncbi:MAG: B12-binding domain-containing radical SAM protein [Armatimonadota bacterium]